MKWREFFHQWGGYILPMRYYGDSVTEPPTVEDLYQAFRERVIEELIVRDSNWSPRCGRLDVRKQFRED